MARNNMNVVTRFSQGAHGKEIVFKIVNGQSFSAKYPDMSQVVYNEAQLKCREIFANAARFASDVYRDPEKKAAWVQRGIRPEDVYYAALREYVQLHTDKKTSASVKKDFQQYLDSLHLKGRQVKALNYLIKHNRLTNALYQQMNKVSKATATRDLQDLVSRQLILPPASKGAGAVYFLSDIGR